MYPLVTVRKHVPQPVRYWRMSRLWGEIAKLWLCRTLRVTWRIALRFVLFLLEHRRVTFRVLLMS